MPEKDNWFQRFLNIQTSQPVMPGVATSAAAFNRDIPRVESTVGDDLAYTGALLASPLMGTNFVKNMAIGLPAFEVFDRLPTLIGQDRATVQGGNLLEKGFRAISPDGRFENTVAPYVNQAGQVIAGLPVGGFGELFARRAASGIAGALDRAAQKKVASRLGYFEPMSDVLSAEHLQSFEIPEINVAPIVEQKAVQAAVPYTIDDLGGGYMLKSLMRGNPLEKQMGKNGTVNVNNIRALVGKGSKVEQAVVDKVLASDAFAGKKSIDYNKFRKAVQDELITYERVPNKEYAEYGMDRIGQKPQLSQWSSDWATANNFIVAHPELDYAIDDAGNIFAAREVPGLGKIYDVRVPWEEISQRYPGWKQKYAMRSATPETFTFESPRIPNGSAKHYGPNTLGHSRTYTTADEPDVLHVMESQSDWAQEGRVAKNAAYVKDRMAKHPGTESDPDSWLSYAKGKIKTREEEVESFKKMLETGVSDNGEKLEPHAIKQIKDELLPASERRLAEAKARFYGPTPQEFYLTDNYTSRQIQENLRYAAEKGQKKMRYPTRETAAKIEGYQPAKDTGKAAEVFDWLKRNNRESSPYSSDIYEKTQKLQTAIDADLATPEDIKRAKAEIKKLEALEARWLKGETTYSKDLETILSKYEGFPKEYQKLYKNADVRTVTDQKGNTWYEVDVPENYLQQEWAFRQGGLISRLQKHYGSNEKALEAVRKFAGGGPLGDEYAGPPAPYVPSESIKDYIKSMEAFRGDWYNDGNGIPTVGYGFTGKNVRAAYPNGMTREQADAYFDDLVTRFARRMSQLTPNIDRLTQNQKDALFSYFYNIGEGNYSTGSPKMQQALKDMDWDTVVQNIDAGYNDKKNPGLKKRRDYERALFERDIPRPLMPIPPARNVGFLYNPNIQRTVGTIPLSGGINETYNPAMYRSGGKIHIKPENRGKFTALKKRTGHSASWFKAHGTPAQKKMATFALNARKWKHGDGGIIDRLYNHSGGDVNKMLELIQKARSA